MATQNEGQGDGEVDIGLTESDLRDRIDNEAPEKIKETLGRYGQMYVFGQVYVFAP